MFDWCLKRAPVTSSPAEPGTPSLTTDTIATGGGGGQSSFGGGPGFRAAALTTLFDDRQPVAFRTVLAKVPTIHAHNHVSQSCLLIILVSNDISFANSFFVLITQIICKLRLFSPLRTHLHIFQLAAINSNLVVLLEHSANCNSNLINHYNVFCM